MNYDYRCIDCSKPKKNHVFIISHGMNEKPHVICPKCGGKNTEKTFTQSTEFYTRGYGYKDRKGCQRDQNLFKLMTDDPYKKMREPGEAEDLAKKLRRGGKHDPKRKTTCGKNPQKL